VLTQDPFLLQKGDQIFVKFSASNLYGQSELSLTGGSSVVVLKPDPPRFLQKVSQSASAISFSWSDGLTNGGTPIIDYFVYYYNNL
jgi:hypothetical protein